jgi:hypothetical protein
MKTSSFSTLVVPRVCLPTVKLLLLEEIVLTS